MAQTTWQDFNSFLETVAEMVSTKTECSILLCSTFYAKHFQLFCRLSLALLSVQSVCVVSGVRHEVKESSKWSPRQDREGQVCKAACVKMERKAT